MKYIIKDEDGNNLYKIYPYENGLCWCIDEYAEVTPRDKTKKPYHRWKFTEKYPTTLLRAFEIVQELMLKTDDQFIKDYKELKKTLTKHNKLILEAIEKGK